MQFHKEFIPIVSWQLSFVIVIDQCKCQLAEIGPGKWAGRAAVGWLGQGRVAGWVGPRDLCVVGRWAKQHLRLEICF